jgi:hypothetical protein
MKVLRHASEAEVVTAFLQAEFYQPEFDADRQRYEQIVMQPNLDNRIENTIRRSLLFRRRGHMWRELPADTQWVEVALEPQDFSRIRVFPRAHWRRFSGGTFQLDHAVEYIRNNPNSGTVDPVIAKIQAMRNTLASGKLGHGAILLIGVDEQRPFTILEGNHRIAAGYLLDPMRVHQFFRVLCGLSPRMTESCWYQTNFPNLFRYLKNRVRNIYDKEADLDAVLRRLQPPAKRPIAAAMSASQPNAARREQKALRIP